MFTNFIYFLTALILYTTCTYPEGVYKLPDHAAEYAAGIILLFFFTCQFFFKRVAKQHMADSDNAGALDYHLNKYIQKLSIFSLIIFTIDLYCLRLKLFLSDYKLFHLFPTLHAVLFLLLFLFYLIIIWNSAWVAQKRLFPASVTRKDYILSNISFSMPALIPWFLLSIIADSIQIMPFKALSDFIATPFGEICYIFIFLILMALFGPVLVQKIWNCRPLENGITKTRIQELCTRTNLKFAEILKWELFGGSMITAGVMGLWSRFRYLLVTPALVKFLDGDEIDAVISHEIGHIKKRHLYFYVLFFAGYMACVYFLFNPLMLLIHSSVTIGKLSVYFNINHDTLTSIAFSLILISVFLFYFRYIFGYMMRNFERQADIFVFSVVGDVSGLINTFYKIVRFSGQSPDKPNWHHFSISQRIRFLEECRIEPAKINLHNKKISRIIQCYIIGLLLVCWAGYSINSGSGSKYLNSYIAEKVLNQVSHKGVAGSELLGIIGDFSFSMKKYKDASKAWEQVIKLEPDNIHALNNLAWLYATCEDIGLRNKKKSLEYALAALKIERAPYILDTYAEACLLNKFCRDAVTASNEALNLADPGRKNYYLKQYNKIRQICNN